MSFPKIPHRVRQVLFYTRVDRKDPPELPADIQARLNEPMGLQFRILSNGDQEHLIEVARYIESHGGDDDTITAGLLHDVGKACRKCNITVFDRCLHVFLNRVAPGPYRLFARRETAPQRLMGLHRLANHAKRGALAARQAGYSERIAWLIEHHEDDNPSDPALRLIQEADNIAVTGSTAS